MFSLLVFVAKFLCIRYGTHYSKVGGVGWGYLLFEPVFEISNNVVCPTSKGSDQPTHTRCLIRVFARHLNFL